MKRSLYLLLAFVGALSVGCGGSDEAGEDGRTRIAVIPKGTTHEFWKAGEAGAKAAAEALGVEVIWKGPQRENDRAGQIKVVENFINQGVDGIALAPLDDKALVRPVKEAQRAGIEVAIWDSGLDESAAGDYVSFIATDNFKAGEMCGQKLGELLGGAGKVVMLRHAVGHASTTKREEGFLAGLARSAPGVERLSTDQRGGTSIDEALKASENLLNQYGDQVQGVFAPNESTTQGMLRALEDSGLAGKVSFVGFDSNDTLIAALEAGKISALAVQNPYMMGYTAVENLVGAIEGRSVEARVDTGAVMLTAENLDTPEMQSLLNPGQ